MALTSKARLVFWVGRRKGIAVLIAARTRQYHCTWMKPPSVDGHVAVPSYPGRFCSFNQPSGYASVGVAPAPLFTKLPRETVRKGFRIAARASILAPHSSEIGLFRPFRGLLRLQFGARGDFSDSLRETVRKGARAASGTSILLVPSSEIGLLRPVSSTFEVTVRSISG